MDDTILKHLNKIFEEVLERDHISLKLNSTTKDIDGWESATHMMIINKIEETYNIEFELDDLWNMENIGDLIKVIQKYTG